MRNDFCIFVLTYGRPHNQRTLNTLSKLGVKYPVYLVCSDDDKELGEYQKLYGKQVVVFNKEQAVKEMGIDLMDNFGNKKAIIYARNYAFVLAKQLGYRYFWELDDDYYEFAFADFKRGMWDSLSVGHSTFKEMDRVLEACLEYYASNPKLLGLSFSQGGDFIGGLDNKQRVKRKCMNSFFCDTERPFLFRGTLNEDVNFYAGDGARDGICLQLHNIKLQQTGTQKTDGGMKDIYLDGGTYIKSFYSIMINPSAVKISLMGDLHLRLHHRIDYNGICPKIIREEYKHE